MAITKPVMFTSVEDAEVSFTRPVSEETVRKMIQNSNLLAELAKIGSIRCIQINVQGGKTPNTDIFQICAGGEIVQPSSPLVSIGAFHRFTPNLKNKFIRGAADEVSNFDSGANTTVNLSHSHGTGTHGYDTVGEEGDERHGYDGDHNHPVASDLNSAEPLNPAHIQVGLYLKIN